MICGEISDKEMNEIIRDALERRLSCLPSYGGSEPEKIEREKLVAILTVENFIPNPNNFAPSVSPVEIACVNVGVLFCVVVAVVAIAKWAAGPTLSWAWAGIICVILMALVSELVAYLIKVSE